MVAAVGHSTKQLDYDLFIVFPQQPNTTLHGGSGGIMTCLFCSLNNQTLHYMVAAVGHSTKQLDYDLFIVFPQQPNTTLHGGSGGTLNYTAGL